MRKPFYRLIAIDGRSPRDGIALEELGIYHPTEKAERQFIFDEAKVRAWLDKGAQASDTVRGLLNKKSFYL